MLSTCIYTGSRAQKVNMLGDANRIINSIESDLKEILGKDFSFYNCQRRALKKVLNLINSLQTNGRSRLEGIIQMPTGTGKTLLAGAIIIALIKKGLLKNGYVIFLAPRSILRMQAYNTFKKLLKKQLLSTIVEVKEIDKLKYLVGRESKSNYAHYLRQISKRLYEFHMQKHRSINKNIKILLLTPQLLKQAINKHTEILKQLEPYAVICDEAHMHYVGEKTSDLIRKLKEKTKAAFIGLTATPTKKAYELFGELIFYESFFRATIEGIVTPKLILEIYNTEITDIKLENLTNYKSKNDEWGIAIKERAEKYAELIVRKMNDLIKKLDRYPKAAVIAANTREADLLANNLREKLPQDIQVIKAHYKVHDPSGELSKFKRQDKGILVTVRMIDIGFDDPNLEVLFICRPIKKPGSYIQIRGRVLRKPRSKENMKEKLGYALIVDFTNSVLEYEKKIRDYEDMMFNKDKGINLDEEFLNPELRIKEPHEIPLAIAKVSVKEVERYESIPLKEIKVPKGSLLKLLSQKNKEYRLVIDDLRFKKLWKELMSLLKMEKLNANVSIKDVNNRRHNFTLTLSYNSRRLYLEIHDKVGKKKRSTKIFLGIIGNDAIVRISKEQFIKIIMKFINAITNTLGFIF